AAQRRLMRQAVSPTRRPPLVAAQQRQRAWDCTACACRVRQMSALVRMRARLWPRIQTTIQARKQARIRARIRSMILARRVVADVAIARVLAKLLASWAGLSPGLRAECRGCFG